MSDIEFDHGQLVSRLNGVVAETTQQRDVHAANKAAYAVSAAGRDFAAQGQRLSSVLAQLHANGLWRINNMEATAAAAREQFTAVHNGNETFGDRLGGRS